MTPKGGVLGSTGVLRSPRGAHGGPQGAFAARLPAWSIPHGAGLWPPGSPAAGTLSVRSVRSPMACLPGRTTAPAQPPPLSPPPRPIPLQVRSCAFAELPVGLSAPPGQEPRRSQRQGRAGPVVGRQEAADPAGGGAGKLRMCYTDSTNLVLRPEPAWRHRCHCRWGRGRGWERSVAGPEPGLRPPGSGRACCSEPCVRRGTRAARVGTPHAPGPGPAAAAASPLRLPRRLPSRIRALPRRGEGARGASLRGRGLPREGGSE